VSLVYWFRHFNRYKSIVGYKYSNGAILVQFAKLVVHIFCGELLEINEEVLLGSLGDRLTAEILY